MAIEQAPRDENYVPAMLFKGSDGFTHPVQGDEVTGRIYVDTSAGGGVTNVATGTGLTGGPITTTGTISLNTKLSPIDTLTGNALKFLRVNAGETAVEYAAVAGGGITIGTTTITSGTNTRILYNNAGVVGEYTLTGSGTVVAMQTAPTFAISITTPSVLATANDSGALGASGTAFSDLFLASGGVINWNSGASTLTHSLNTLTLGGSGATTLALGTNSITMTGSLAATGARVTKGWFTDIESTNMPTVGGTSLSSTFAAIAGSTAQAFSASTIDLGNADTTLARVSAGVVSIEGNNIVTNTSSPTLGTITTTGNIELGNASDTTLSRVSAGVVAIEGVNIVKAGAVTTNGITMSTARLLGRTTASTGAIEEITVGTGLSLSGGSLTATSSGGGFPVQEIAISTSSSSIGNTVMTSTTDGLTAFVAYDQSSTTATILRLVRDSNTSNYYVTHSTTLAISPGSLGGIACDSTYLYVTATIAGVGSVRRYSIADLSGVTTMTISGTNSFGSGQATWLEGTNLYTQSSASTFRKYAISGTTLTDTTTISYTTSGNPIYGAISDGTNVWMTDGAGGGTAINIRKYPIAGGSSTSTTSMILRADAYYQTSTSANTGIQFILGSSSILGIGWGYSSLNPTAAIGQMLHIQGITLP